MNPYITFRDRDKNGELKYYILQREFPHYLCVISGMPEKLFVAASAVAGYNLYIVFSGSLRGGLIPSYKNVDKEIMLVMEDMALWYYANRILMEEKKFKKFKIKNDTISTE